MIFAGLGGSIFAKWFSRWNSKLLSSYFGVDLTPRAERTFTVLYVVAGLFMAIMGVLWILDVSSS